MLIVVTDTRLIAGLELIKETSRGPCWKATALSDTLTRGIFYS